tara:strand:- start:119 stop:286 length:168 start_codon:yes stop_codon:yes gene_type:complete
MSQAHPIVHPIPPVLAAAQAIAEFLWIIKLVTHVFSDGTFESAFAVWSAKISEHH